MDDQVKQYLSGGITRGENSQAARWEIPGQPKVFAYVSLVGGKMHGVCTPDDKAIFADWLLGQASLGLVIQPVFSRAEYDALLKARD